ncbi:MAG: hypothetical protein N3E46_15520, partial [Gemmataceae bacterium]|nr:hypothetical protein [Gemmataceae bacterium]
MEEASPWVAPCRRWRRDVTAFSAEEGSATARESPDCSAVFALFFRVPQMGRIRPVGEGSSPRDAVRRPTTGRGFASTMKGTLRFR